MLVGAPGVSTWGKDVSEQPGVMGAIRIKFQAFNEKVGMIARTTDRAKDVDEV